MALTFLAGMGACASLYKLNESYDLLDLIQDYNSSVFDFDMDVFTSYGESISYGFSRISYLTVIALMTFLVSSLLFSAQQVRAQFFNTFFKTIEYYQALTYYYRGGSYVDSPYFPESVQARIQVYSLSLITALWSKPHYRNGDFQEDMIKNLCDIAIPGTGFHFGHFAYFKPLVYFFLLVLYPLVAIVAALNRAIRLTDEETGPCAQSDFLGRFSACYLEQLLTPQDWFSYWRLNCRLATLHSSVTGEEDYALEDKWTFLAKAQELKVAVSPSMSASGIMCKHRNEEGGLGIHAFKNACVGGDWIIQQTLANSPFLASMLPDNAPLSTFRVISASRGGLKSGTGEPVVMDDIKALSCVWRAGRQNAITDHSAVLFNVDPNTGVIKKGTSNQHWFQRGFSKVFTTPWLSKHDYTHHPDTGGIITGKVVPNIEGIMKLVSEAHLRLNPHVPMCGWDVALTKDHGMLLLEVNFSCNFFRGMFDKSWYYDFVDDYFLKMEERSQNI